MAIFRYQSAAPVRSALVDRLMMVSLRWLQWFQEVGDYIGAQGRQDYAYDPPNLAPGALATVNVTFTGAVFGDMVKACEFYPPAVGGVPTARGTAAPATRVAGSIPATAPPVRAPIIIARGAVPDCGAGRMNA